MNDHQIRELFEHDEHRPPRLGYWGEIQARLEAVDTERASAKKEASENTDTDVVLIRPSTMKINDYSRKTQRILFLAAAAVLVALLGVGQVLRSSGDGDITEIASDETTEQANGTTNTSAQGDDGGSNATATPVTADKETTVSSAENAASDPESDTTTDSAVSDLVNEAENGLRFDYGIIERIEEVDGTVWIWFDRVGFSDEQLSGLDHTVEPRYELASDWHGGENVNPRLRTFPLADDAAVLLLNPVITEVVCGGDQTDDDPFDAYTAAAVIVGDWPQRTVSLTFNEARQVTIVRDQTAC